MDECVVHFTVVVRVSPESVCTGATPLIRLVCDQSILAVWRTPVVYKASSLCRTLQSSAANKYR